MKDRYYHPSVSKKTVTEEDDLSISSDMSSYEFDVRVAKYIVNKADSCKKRGIEWKLNFCSVKNLLKSKRCYYTGVLLTIPVFGEPTRDSDFSVDRIDSSKPYEKGNVVACCRKANQFKSLLENQTYELDIKTAHRILTKTLNRIK